MVFLKCTLEKGLGGFQHNKSTLVAQVPADDDDENESCKAWTMEMLMNNSDISMSMMNEEEMMSEDKKVLICQSGTLKPLNAIPHASNNQMTKGG